MTRVEQIIQDRLEKAMAQLKRELDAENEILTDCSFTVQVVDGEFKVSGGSTLSESKPPRGSWRRDLSQDNEPAG